jgi:hypothetical protein
MSGSVRYDTVSAHRDPSSSLAGSLVMNPGQLRGLRVVVRGAAGPGSCRSGTNHA